MDFMIKMHEEQYRNIMYQSYVIGVLQALLDGFNVEYMDILKRNIDAEYMDLLERDIEASNRFREKCSKYGIVSPPAKQITSQLKVKIFTNNK